MKKTKLFAAMLAGITSVGVAQAQVTTNVEIIHNSPDPLAETVDIYVNGQLLPELDDVSFRTTTGFLPVPAGLQLTIGVAPGTSNTTGNGAADIIPSTVTDVTFNSGTNYVVVANGFVDGTNFNPAPAFALDVFVGARLTADGGAGTNDVLVYHGSTDAPAVDVDELLVVQGEAVDGIAYSQFQGYLPLGVEDYLLQIQADATGDAVAAFSAPLATLGVDGAALTVLASGFLAPGANGLNNGPAFGLFVSTGAPGALIELPSPTARVEIIHNAADTLLDVVDVFVNGEEAVSDFAFRTSTGFIDLPAGMPLDINAAPDGAGLGGSVDLADIPFLMPSESYIAIANGTVSPGYAPQQTLGLNIFSGARETATAAGNTDVLVYHGATDAPAVDVAELQYVGGQIIDDLTYGQFVASYFELETLDYLLQLQDGSGNPLTAYNAPLSTLGLQDSAITVLASGFFDENNEGEAFGLWVSLGNEGPLVELPTALTNVEIIHNAADTALDLVDVYLNDELAIEDFAFRTTTGYIDLPAGMPINVKAAPAGAGLGNAADILDVPFLRADTSYIVIANGTVSPGYTPQQPLGADVFAGARLQGSDPTQTDILVYHGATDAPAVDVEAVGDPFTLLVDGAAYGGFAGYLTVPTVDYTLQIQADANDAPVAAYDALLETAGLEGQAVTVLASGFLDGDNNGTPAFGLFGSLGVEGPLLALPTPEARIEVIHNSADAAAEVVDVFINEAEAISDFEFRTTTGFITLPAGMPLTIQVAPDGAGLAGALPAIEIPFLASGETYIAIADGIVSATGYSPDATAAPFGLQIYAGAREVATSGAGNTDVLVYHGSTDAPTVDVAETGLGAGTIVDDIAWSEYNSNGYLELQTNNYQLTIQDETGMTNVAVFDAPLANLGLQDSAITVIASGFLNPDNNSGGDGFGLWVSLGNAGDLIPLTNVTGIQEVESVSNAILFPNPTNDNATMFFDLTQAEDINFEVVNTMGQQVYVKSFGNMISGNHRVDIPASELAPGFYFVNLRTNTGVVSTKLQVVR